MSRITIFLASLLILFNCSAATESKELTVHFETDQSTLTKEARDQLDHFLEHVELNGDYAFHVFGHTDSEGSLAYNERLSLARAAVVRAYLIDHGTDPGLINMERFGERDPLASNFDPDGMSQNRRVQVKFERITFTDLDELRAALAEGTVQHFSIDPTKPNFISGKAGVQIAISANALVDQKGRPAKGPVDIELTEAVDMKAMMAHQLNTRSGEHLLETGGMYNLVAVDSNGEPLRVQASMPMNVTLPNEQPLPGMEIFTSNDGSDWKTTRVPIGTTMIETWSAPPFPLPPTQHYPMPHYRIDLKGRPMKPSEPMEPREPIAPRIESYTTSSPWWSFLLPEKANSMSNARYEAALERFDEEMKQREQELITYNERCSDLPNALERYVVRKAAWDQIKKQEYALWYETEYRTACKKADMLMAPKREAYQQRMEEWRQARDASMARYVMKADSVGVGSIEAVRAYTFATADLGWINCDRFMNIPDILKRFVIASEDQKETKADVFVVLNSMRSILGLERNSLGQYRSQAIPKSEPAMIFAYTIIDGRPHVCMKPIEESGKVDLEYMPSSFAEIGRLLNGFKPKVS